MTPTNSAVFLNLRGIGDQTREELAYMDITFNIISLSAKKKSLLCCNNFKMSHDAASWFCRKLLRARLRFVQFKSNAMNLNV